MRSSFEKTRTPRRSQRLLRRKPPRTKAKNQRTQAPSPRWKSTQRRSSLGPCLVKTQTSGENTPKQSGTNRLLPPRPHRRRRKKRQSGRNRLPPRALRPRQLRRQKQNQKPPLKLRPGQPRRQKQSRRAQPRLRRRQPRPSTKALQAAALRSGSTTSSPGEWTPRSHSPKVVRKARPPPAQPREARR